LNGDQTQENSSFHCATKGQITTIKDAGWSYGNEKNWYIITGRATPEQLTNSMVNIDTKNH